MDQPEGGFSQNAISRPWSPSYATISTMRPTFKTQLTNQDSHHDPRSTPRQFPAHDQWILATSRTNSLQWSWVHQSIHSSESFPSKAPPCRWPFVIFSNKEEILLLLVSVWCNDGNVLQMTQLLTLTMGLRAQSGKCDKNIFFYLSLPLAPTWFSVLDILKMAIWNWILNIGVAGKYSSLGKSDSAERISIQCNGIFGTSPMQYTEAVKYDATH